MTDEQLETIAKALLDARHKAAWCFDDDSDYRMIVAHFNVYLGALDPAHNPAFNKLAGVGMDYEQREKTLEELAA